MALRLLRRRMSFFARPFRKSLEPVDRLEAADGSRRGFQMQSCIALGIEQPLNMREMD